MTANTTVCADSATSPAALQRSLADVADEHPERTGELADSRVVTRSFSYWWAGLTALLFMVPYGLNPDCAFSLQLDPSWLHVMDHDFAVGAQWGTDVVFPHGPYGYLIYSHYNPETWMYALPLRLLICIAMALGIERLCTMLRWSRLATIVLTGGIALLHYPDSLPVVPVFLVLGMWILSERRKLPWESHLLCVVLGILCLVKFNLLCMVAAVILPLSCHQILQRRHPTHLLTVGVSVFILWVAAGQSLLNIPAYLTTSLDLSAGYSEAMSFWTDESPRSLLIRYSALGVPAIALACFAFWSNFRRDRGKAILLPASILGLFFLIFKMSYVRADGHMLAASSSGVFLGIFLCGVCYATTAATGMKHAVLAAVSYSALLFMVIQPSTPNTLAMSLKHIDPKLLEIGRALRNPRRTQQSYEARIELVKSQLPIPQLAGTVDVYSFRQAAAIANGLNHHHRPCVQSYAAYTPHLLQLNAAFLRRPDAPENLLFEVTPIDNWYPSLDDSLSWPEILARYACQTQYGPLLHLKRKPEGGSFRLVPNRTLHLKAGENVELSLPDGELCWAELQLNPTRLRKLLVTLHKDQVSTLNVNGQDFRLIPAIANAGFLLSPMVTTTEQFRALIEGKTEALSKVKTIRVQTHGRYFHPDYELRLYRLELTREHGK